MIIVNLKGGLGNQMFQYALGRHLAIKLKTVLKLDTAGLERANAVGDIYRPFDLCGFTLSAPTASAEEIKRLKYPYSVFSKAWRWSSFKLSKDKNTIFNPRVLEWTGDIYLDGYWQSPKYFESAREEILKEFSLAATLSPAAATYATLMQGSNSVSLHVRRGDYVKNARVQAEFGSCTLGYYEKAVEYIKSKFDSPTFFVFSDDITWVKENLSLHSSTVYVKDPSINTAEELVLMGKCKHNIIANSSFSWWGAWLNQNPAKIVIAPTPWFDIQPYDKDLIPDTWIQLPK